MKICHITSVHPRYDIRIFIKECRSLSANHQVSLIVADSLGDELKDQIQIYDVGMVSGSRIKRMRITSLAIYHKVLELKPEIVHFHDPELNFIARKLQRRGFKVIYDVHEDTPKQILSKQWIPKLLRPLIAKFVAYQERVIAAEFSGIITATELIAKRFISLNRNVISIHNYPLLSELNVINAPWDTRQARLIYLGSISATRGILPLIQSLAISQLHLDLAGKFSDDKIKQQIAAMPESTMVDYHGVLNRNQVAQILSRVSIGIVTLLPTPSYVESLPIKLFEYMLAKVPVVASDFPLWAEIIQKYNCGLMVDPTNPKQIADACSWLLANQDTAKQMGENGYNAVINNYTWEQEQVKLLEFYQSLSH